MGTDSGYLSVDEQDGVSISEKQAPGQEETFQWIELERGDLALMSLRTNRFLNAKLAAGVNAMTDVPSPTSTDGSSFIRSVVE